MFILLVADTSLNSNCTIISTSLTTLTTDGGVLVNGTQNVTIYCLCMLGDVVMDGARWFFPDSSQVRVQAHADYQPGGPYYLNILPTPLIIPNFINPYDGTYRCGPSSSFDNAVLFGDSITLTLGGKYK